MTDFAQVSLLTIAGITAVTLIATGGAVASRKLNFNYGWLTMLSLVVYTGIPYFILATSDLRVALLANCVIGLYDATVGWKLALILNANMRLTAEEIEETSLASRLFAMLAICLGCGYLADWLY